VGEGDFNCLVEVVLEEHDCDVVSRHSTWICGRTGQLDRQRAFPVPLLCVDKDKVYMGTG
jgi:hypothetical protein